VKRRKIGKLYDTEKFHKAAEDAARAFVSRVMDGFADTEKGRATYERILGNLKKQIADTPTEYYKTLDAFIDGKDIFAEAEFHRSAEDLEYFKSQGACGIIDLLGAYKDGSWTVKDPAEAEKYYDGLFPEARKSADKVKDVKAARAAAKLEVKARIKRFDSEAKKIVAERSRILDAVNGEHAAFIEEKNIDRKDPAYGLLDGLYQEFKKENKSLGKLEDLVLATQRKLIPYEVYKEYGVITERELEEHDFLKAKEKVASMDLECYMNALDDLGEVRYKNGIISEKLYLMILSEPEKSTRPHLETEKEVSEGIRVDISLAKARVRDATKENELVTEKETERSEPEI